VTTDLRFEAIGGLNIRELLLLRHGKSGRPAGVADFDRPLKKRGIRNARQIGEWLAANDLVPDLCVSSTAARAADTAWHACDAMDLEETRLQFEPRLYLPDLNTLLAVVHGLPESFARVLLVSHNPGSEDFAVEFAQPTTIPSGESRHLPTAALVAFRLDEVWRDAGWGRATRLARILPRELS
jgi:phosphohistidine phosphatase